jgi:dihydrofolate reductase
MRKLKLQVQITMDGFIAGPKGEMDWMVWDWDDELKKYVEEITEPVDCIILGRNLAQGFIPHWAKVASNPDHPEFQAGIKFTNTHKVVFTRTLSKSEWSNTVLAKGDLADEITQLKKQKGQDIIVYGGAAFVSALIEKGLIDEYHLFMNPTAIGSGMAIFKALNKYQKMVLESSRAYPCGIVVNRYRKAI